MPLAAVMSALGTFGPGAMSEFSLLTGKTVGHTSGKCVSRNVREPSHVLARHTEAELDTIFRERVRYRVIGLPV